jgi:hypothetical protein
MARQGGMTPTTAPDTQNYGIDGIADAIKTTQDDVYCVVCGTRCIATGAEGIFEHDADAPCIAILVDAAGESLDRQYFIADDGFIYEVTQPVVDAAPVPPEDVIADATDSPDVASEIADGISDVDEDEDYEDELPVLPSAPPPPKPRKRRTKKADIVPSILPAGAATAEDGTLLLPTERDLTITPLDKGLHQVFKAYEVPRLGGASGDLGWSSFSTYQRCPYLFKRLYIDGLRYVEERPPNYIEIGSAVHAFLAVYYQQFIDPAYPLTPEILNKALLDAGCDAAVLMEAWRLWAGYALFYEQDFITPLAVEYHVVDSETKESARYDLIAKVEKADSRFPAGTYVVEHKTTGRFDTATLDGWQNDGEVIGQIMLWQRLKLTRKFGKLTGVMMNIIGKQRQQQFHRTLVVPQRWQIKQHANDLRMWQGMRLFMMAGGIFPRARANCVSRYGMCSQWDHCAHREG